MSTALLDQLRCLADSNNWDAIVAAKKEILAMTGPAAVRAEGIHSLACAHWYLGRDPWDYALAIRFARQAVQLNPLQGRWLRSLGSMLVTIGRFAEGRQVLQKWINGYRDWDPSVQAYLPDVQYTLGYAVRYEGNPAAAVLWYRHALSGFAEAGRQEWVVTTCCALVQSMTKAGQLVEARALLDDLPLGSRQEAYRLKAVTELLAAEGNIDEALAAGELAVEHLIEIDDFDPWELAELHILLAHLQFQAGNVAQRQLHADLALDALRASERHDLYRMACLLLDYDREEVIA